ncbi:unnamed protein product [Staurois parvus]|uniref:Uncharacterized protein n=1 Tax=Staurois parvus TaxID=386267 RepID=A0ABN9GFL0_9NEOB|nr:unnamed protein product [Staurois parvus]
MYVSAVSGRLLHRVRSLRPSPVLCPQSPGRLLHRVRSLRPSPAPCPQSPAVSCTCPQSPAVSCTTSAVSGHLL